MFDFKKLNSGKIRIKVIATVLILTLTFANFGLLGSYIVKAVEADVNLSNQGDRTNSQNVKFDVYLDETDRNVKEKTEEITSDEAKLYISVSVQGGGYLNNPEIEVLEGNFKFKNNPSTTKFKLDSIQTEKGISVGLPVIAKNDESYNLNLLNMQSQIKLTGEYIDDNGNVTDIDTTKAVKITWTANELTEENIVLSGQIITNKIYNINGANKRVIQMLVASKIKDNIAPVKSSIIEISNPKIEAEPEEVKVASYSTKATNGKGSLEFEESNYEYNKEEQKLTIKANNEVNEQNAVSWAKNSEDKYVVTYVYDEDVNIAPFICDVKTKIDIYGRTEETIEKTNTIKLEEIAETGDIAKLESSATKNIYKGNMYIGEDTNFETKANIYVPYSKIANKIIVEDLGDTIVEAEDVSTYYKETKINKAEALKVLGTEGTIKVYNAENKTTPIKEIVLSDEIEGDYYTVSYDEPVNKIVVEMSTVKTEGTIEIINEKAIKVSDQEVVPEISELKTNLLFTVSDENNNVFVNYNIQSTANILEPVTEIDTTLDKNSLSTQVENELKITTELKTANNSNKLFENPVVKVELPKEIKEVSLENISKVLYDDELKLKSSNIVTNEAGNKELVMELEGKQTKYTDSTVDNGATVIADLKVKTDKFMANKNVEINSTCINGAENASSKESIELESKTGLITKNTLSAGTNVIEKVNQNNLSLAIAEDTNVTVSSSIINNFDENISNINIVGKIPEGTALTSAILSNTKGMVISYSEETNPAIDSSSWKTEVTDYSKVKSFKLALSEMTKASLIDLKYELKANVSSIKEDADLVNDLNINYAINGQVKEEKIAFTLNVVKKQSNPETLQTGAEQSSEEKVAITITPKTTTDTLHQGQIVTYEIKATNISTETLNNLTLDYTVPEGAVLTELTYAQADEMEYTDKEESNVEWEIESLAPNQTITKEVTLKIKDNSTEIVNVATLKDAQNSFSKQYTNTKTVNEGKLEVRLSRRDNMEIQLSEGSSIKYIVLITNNTNTTINNLKITSKIPEQTSWVEDSEYNTNWNYDKNTNNVNYTINTLNPGETLDIWFEVKVGKLEDTSAKIYNTAVVTTSDGEQYETNIYTSNVITPKWDITMTSSNSEILKEGETIKYIIKVSNSGKRGSSVFVEDILPEQINPTKLTYYIDEENKVETTPSNNETHVLYPVEVGETLTIEIEGIIKELENSISSKQITNVAKINLGDGEYLESEKIVNTIVNDMQNPGDLDSNESNPSSISGMAWLDENKNGIRDNQEEPLQAIKVILLDKEGKQVEESTTSLAGTYKFNDVEKGEYVVVFEYDTSKYVVTKYQVQGVTESINSDAISKQIEINGETKTAGVTDTVKIDEKTINKDIDIGLIENAKFDLRLDKYINKVVLTNNSGTTTYEYENTNFTKVEISAKKIAGTVLLVEYELQITNEGDVDGYVGDVIDYLPEGLVFTSETNKDWYMDGSGVLHNKTLSEQVLKAGETKSVTLVLTKTLKGDSTGTIENIAEIGESSNLEQIVEHDSIVGNKKAGEDDISTASLIVSIATGSPMMYIGIVIASMIVLGTGIYIIDKKVLRVRM